VLVTLLATLTEYDSVVEAKAGDSAPAEAARPLKAASLLFGYTYAPMSQPVPLLFWLSNTTPPGQVEAGSRPHSYAEPTLAPASMAGEDDWRDKLGVEVLTNWGLAFRECASCPVVDFQLAKL
jgi:hypothetical protein